MDGDQKAPNDKYGPSRPGPMTYDELQDMAVSILRHPTEEIIGSPIKNPKENLSKGEDTTENHSA